MSGPDDVTVVWVAPDAANAAAGAHAGPGEGRDDAKRALIEWARARGLRVHDATESTRGALEHVDLTIADRVEKELDRARDATSAADADGAERALARADTLLREHPELPQAAWLRAEVHRSWAARWTRVEPRDDQRAKLAWQEADALDGGRAPGIGEVAFPARPRTATTLNVHGAASRKLVTRLDGADLSGTTTGDGTTTYTLDVAAAEHQLVVTVDGETVFASWVAIAESPPTTSPPPVVSVRVASDGACTASSFGGVSADGTGGVRAASAACDHWVAAMPSERRGGVLVARCERNACGPFLEWRGAGSFDAAPEAVPPHVRRGGAWPAWATWTAFGVGAVAATTITLIATGVLESRPTEQRFVAGGVRVE